MNLPRLAWVICGLLLSTSLVAAQGRVGPKKADSTKAADAKGADPKDDPKKVDPKKEDANKVDPNKLPLSKLAPAKLIPNLCVVQYPITTSSPECQAYFNQGLGYFYSYV